MTKKNEIELLITRYKADIAALEDRKDDLMRHIEILENLIPIFLVWSMWKSAQLPYSPETPSPQHEIEKAKEHMARLETVLGELKQAVELIKGEEQIMRKRIDELEEIFSDQLKHQPNEGVPTPEKPETVDVTSEKDKLKVEGLEDSKVKFDEDTDLKNVCEDLLKQVGELNTNLKNSSQQLRESESYAKRLEKEYSRLEKELQEKIKLLETKSDTLVSEVFDKEREKYLQEERESKEALSAMQDALAEVKSMKESLSKSRTLSKDDHIEPLGKVTDFEDSTAALTDVPTLEKPETVDVTSEKGSLQVEGLEDDKVKFDEDTDWKNVCEDLLKQVGELDTNLKNSSQQLRESESYAKRLEKEYSRLEKQLQEKIKLLEAKSDTLVSEVFDKEREKYLQEERESKEALSAMQDALAEVRSMKESLSKSRTFSKDDHIEPLDKVTDVEDSTAALQDDKKTQEESEHLLPAPEAVNNGKDIAAQSEKSFSKETISEPGIDKMTAIKTQAEAAPIFPSAKDRPKLLKHDTAKSVVDSLQTTISKKTVSENAEGQTLTSGISDRHDLPQISAEAETSLEHVVAPSKTLASKPEDQLPVKEPSVDLATTQMSAEAETTSKGEAASPEALASKDAVSEKVEGQLPVLETIVVPDTARKSNEAETISEGIVAPPKALASTKAPVSKDSQINTTMAKRKEIEMLIARYNADIAALEERKVHLKGQIEVVENLVPTVFLWYMSKVYQGTEITGKQGISFPQLEVEEETQEKLKNLKSDLGELQQSVELVEEEQKIIRKRIEELETSLPDQFDKYPDEEIDISIPSIKHKKETDDHKIKELYGEREEFEEQLQAEDTDLKKLCEDLLKQVSELSTNLKNSSQQLKESEDYAKNLEEKCSKLEKELQEKIQLLEKRTGSIASDVVGQEPERYSQEERESREVLSAMEEALAEVRSMKESLSKSRTPSKEEPLIDVQDKASPSEAADIKEDILESVEEGQVSESKKSVVSDTEQTSPEVVATTEDFTVPADASVTKDKVSEVAEKETEAVPEITDISSIAVDKAEDKAAPSEETDIKEDILETVKHSPVPESEKPIVSDTEAEVVATTEDISVPSDASVTKDKVSELAETQLPEKGTEAVPETSDISPTAVDTAEDKAPPSEETDIKEDILESVKHCPVPESEKPIVSDTEAEVVATTEDISVPSDAPVTKDKVSELAETQLPEKETEAVPETSDISPTAVDTAEDKAPPSEETDIKEDISVPSDAPVTKDKVSELAETQLPEKGTDAVPETSDVSPTAVDTAEDKAPPSEETDMKKDILESGKEGQVSESEKSVVHDTEKISPEVEATAEDISGPSDASVTKDKVSELAKSQLPGKGTEAVPETSDISPVAVDTSEDKAPHSEATDMKKDILESVKEGQVPESKKPVVSEPSKIEPSEVEPPISTLLEPTSTQEMPVSGTQTALDVVKPSEEVVIPMKKTPDSSTAGEPVPSDKTEAQTIVPRSMEGTPTDASPIPAPSGDKAPELTTKRPGIHTAQEPGLTTKRPSIQSLTSQTLQSKLLLKDHLIKSMADQLRELARANKWPGRRTFEEATSADPVKTYDFDKNALLLYLKGEEPQDFAESMRSNKEYSSSNPLNVKIIRKVDNDSLLVEWGPLPSAEVVGFQIYVNGQFMYWVHSAKRNLALLHPLDLKLLLEIAVSPINIRGDIVTTSSVTYKPE